jgi:hypothetical protein
VVLEQQQNCNIIVRYEIVRSLNRAFIKFPTLTFGNQNVQVFQSPILERKLQMQTENNRENIGISTDSSW